jgi:hypothetical protein
MELIVIYEKDENNAIVNFVNADEFRMYRTRKVCNIRQCHYNIPEIQYYFISRYGNP